MSADRPATEPRTDTDTALRTADVLWSALRDRLEPEEHIGYGRLYEQMYSWMLDRAEAAQGAAPRAGGLPSDEVDDLVQDIAGGIDGEPYLDRSGWERAHASLKVLASAASRPSDERVPHE